MDYKVTPGLKLRISVKVTKDYTASHLGSGTLDVLATPAMIAFMEKSALMCVEKYLPEGYTTVGTEVNISHLRATGLGEEVNCDAHLQEVDGRRLIFNVEVSDRNGIVGKGTHGRVIIDEEKFMQRIEGLRKI